MTRKFEIYAKSPATLTDKVTAIKSVRWITGMGLKEAKDLVDAVSNGDRLTFTEQDPRSRNPEYEYDTNNEIRIIERCGYTVVEVRDVLTKQVVDLAIDAIHAGDYNLVIDLMRILKERA